MRRFIIRRALASVVTMLLVITAIFALTRSFGDPRTIYLSDEFNTDLSMSKKQWDDLGVEFGLDKPMVYQYGLFIGRLLKGDLGTSVHQRRPVLDLIMERLPATAQLALGAFILTIALGLPLGIISAVRRGTMLDLGGRLLAVLGHALPSFWVAVILVIVFGVYLGWVPTYGHKGINSFILPCITLGWGSASGVLRLTRSSMLEVLDSEYVKLARAKGVSSRSVVWKHALRNALITPLTVAGLTLGGLITGSVIIETVFAWPGIGLLSIQSVYKSDYATVQGVFLFVTAVYIGAAFLVDIAYAWVDPRIRYG